MTTNVTRLKELLFDAESQRLDELNRRLADLAAQASEHHTQASTRHGEISTRVEELFSRAGTEERLRKSVAGILDGAFRDAEVTRHEQLSQAVAPLVVKTIKNELRNSQDEMVDVLYPITGKMVKEYVRAAIADLMADINRRLGGSSPSDLERRANALGITVGQLVVAEAQELKVDELFLVRQGSGQLVAHWERPDGDQPPSAPGVRSNRDELIAGYLSGITQFSEEAFDGKPGSLRSIDLKGEKIFVRSSAAYLLAARCSGRAPLAVEQVIDDVFLKVLADYRQALDATATGQGTPQGQAAIAAMLPDVAAQCETRFAEARRDLEKRARAIKPASTWRLKAMAATLVLAVLGGIGWWSWVTFETNRTRLATEAALGSVSEIEGYPVGIDVERGGKAVSVTGLMPSAAVRERTLAVLDAALKDRATVRSRLGLLPSVALPPDLSSDLGALRRDFASLMSQQTKLAADLAAVVANETKVAADVGAVRDSVQRLPALQTTARNVQADLSALAARVDAIRIPAAGYVPSAREQLDAFARANAVFFGNATDLLDEAAANAVADRLAEQLAKTDASLRIVGHTDEKGSAPANASLAQSRADRVATMLADRGIPRERLIAIGRNQGVDLSRSSGVGSANRRVTFEVGFVGEPK